MILLTNKENKSYLKHKVYHICKMEFRIYDGNKKYHKVQDQCYYTGKNRDAAHNVCKFRYKTSKEIPVVFHMVLNMTIIL